MILFYFNFYSMWIRAIFSPNISSLFFLQNLTLGPEAKIEATMQHEITRLTSENLVKLRTLTLPSVALKISIDLQLYPQIIVT